MRCQPAQVGCAALLFEHSKELACSRARKCSAVAVQCLCCSMSINQSFDAPEVDKADSALTFRKLFAHANVS